MQTIVTMYRGPTDTNGSRILATASGGIRKTYSYDDALSAEANHAFACNQLRLFCEWTSDFVAGADRKTGGLVWVSRDGDCLSTFYPEGFSK